MKRITVFVSMILVLTLLTVSVTPVLAESVTALNEGEPVSAESKIDDVLLKKMEEAADDEKIPVWIWYEDIDQNYVNDKTEQITGLTADNYQTLSGTVSETTISGVLKGDVKSQNEMKNYLTKTTPNRKREYELSQEYITARRSVSNDLYKQKSQIVLDECNLTSDVIRFRSEFAPVIIADLSNEDIFDLSQNSIIASIGLYNENEYEECETPEQVRSNPETSINDVKRSLGLIEVYQKLNLSGNSVKIGIVEGNVPGNKYGNIEDIDELENPEQLTNYINEEAAMLSDLGFNSKNIVSVTYDQLTELDTVGTKVEQAITSFASNPNNGPVKIVRLVEEDNSNYLGENKTYELSPERSLEVNHSHSNRCASIMIGQNDGMAKGAVVYATLQGRGFIPQNEYREFANIESLMKCGVNILVPYSSSNYTQSDLNNLTDIGKYSEHLVSSHHVTLIVPGGNTYVLNEISDIDYGYWINPAGLAYNALTVGGYETSSDNSGNLTYTRMRYRWQNNNANYSASEKPDVLLSADFGGKGTCIAASCMASIIALMMELKPSLMLQPQSVKAIVLASCHKKALQNQDDMNVVAETVYQGITDRQGAGIPDAWIMATIILQNSYHQLTIGAGNTFSKSLELNSGHEYGLNFSITWLKENIPNEITHYNNSHITSFPIPNVDLYYVQNNNIKSNYTNSSTEMCYITMSTGTNMYSFQIVNTDTTRSAKVAYAWSTSNREKELSRVSLNGKAAVGQTLSITSHCDDGTLVPNNALNYQWKRSSDNITWQEINNANTSSYTLTSSDFMKYIKCEATPNNSSVVSGTEKSIVTSTRIVYFGDADLDGVITVMDATHVQRFLAGLITFTDEKMLSADVDGDESITMDDVMLIQRYILGDITSFPVE